MTAMVDLRNIDLRPVDTRHAISAIRKYLELMEAQMPLVQQAELDALEAERPDGGDEVEQSIHWSFVTHTENLFEEDLIPTMRYSFIVFLHTVFETRLRIFCDLLRRERNFPIAVTDLRGSAIEQPKDYLTKFAGIAVADYPEWNSLKNSQKIRDSIVHDHGFVRPKEERFKAVLQIVDSDPDLKLDDNHRICPGPGFCVRQLAKVESFLNHLMTDMGWRID